MLRCLARRRIDRTLDVFAPFEPGVEPRQHDAQHDGSDDCEGGHEAVVYEGGRVSGAHRARIQEGRVDGAAVGRRIDKGERSGALRRRAWERVADPG